MGLRFGCCIRLICLLLFGLIYNLCCDVVVGALRFGVCGGLFDLVLLCGFVGCVCICLCWIGCYWLLQINSVDIVRFFGDEL